MLYLKFKTYAEVMNDFFATEIMNFSSRDKCFDMFPNLDLFRDQYEKLSQTMSNSAQYRYQRKRKERALARIDLILKTEFLQGAQYIICSIKKYKIIKELFVL